MFLLCLVILLCIIFCVLSFLVLFLYLFHRPRREKVDIVYFINTYTNPDTYQYLMISQLTDLVSMTEFMENNVHHVWIECCGNDPNFMTHISKAIPSSILQSRVTVTMHPENNHEYFGIHRVWSLSQSASTAPGQDSQDTHNHYILYFHAKGVSLQKYTEKEPRNSMGKDLFDTVIQPWEKVFTIFQEQPHVDKVGYSFSGQGFMWYNFWWMRASFAKQLEEPIVTKNRYYYEDYSARKPRDPSSPSGPLTVQNYHLSPHNCVGLKIAEVWSPE